MLLKKHKERLYELLYLRSFSSGKFTLRSGKESNYYFDCRRVSLCGEAQFLIGEIIFQMTQQLETVKSIGGMETAAISIVSAVTAAYHRHGIPMEGFYVKKQPKSHGKQQWIEGIVDVGDDVIIVEDVATTGGSLSRAVSEAQAAGAKVVGIVSLIDRLEGAEKLFLGYNYKSVFTVEDFAKHLEKR